MLLGGLTNGPVTVRGDGPEHVRTRRALMAPFASSPREAAADEPMIRGIVAELTDQMQHRGEADLVRDFTWELPVRVLLRLLGVPSEDHARVKRWGDGRAAILFGRMNDTDQVRFEPRYSSNAALRALQSLPVVWDASS
jgi:cytochrome P450